MISSRTTFYVTGGTLQRDAPSYIRRQADEKLYHELHRGNFCYMLTSRQMGKSSLMVRTALRLRQDSAAVAVLDLTALGQNLTAEQWYDGLLGRIGQQFDLEDELEDFWLDHSRLGPLQRWMKAITEVVLPNRSGRIVIFVDEIDAVRSLPFSTDEFFAGIREFYNRRTEDTELKRLTFCLLGVATPSDLIRDTRTTPFNIGQRIELMDFTQDEAAPLAEGLRRAESIAMKLLQRVIYWTGGHPYLTQRLCQYIALDTDVTDHSGVDRLCSELFLSSAARERDDNLLFVRERLLRSEADLASLLDLYAQVRNHKTVRDDDTNPTISILKLSGIIRVVDGNLKLRNRIYERVFDKEWVASNMPDAELRRQRAAYRKGLWRAAAIAAVILAVVTSSAFAAFYQYRRADYQYRRAEASLQLTQQALAQVKEERRRAEEQKNIAEEAQIRANEKAAEADKNAKIADENAKKADANAKEADANAKEADAKAREAQQEKRRADEQTEKALTAKIEEKNRKLAELDRDRFLYASEIRFAQQTFERGSIAASARALQRQVANKEEGKADLRNFEWDYLSHNTAHFIPNASPVKSLAFSSDGKFLATGSREIQLLDARTGRHLFSLSGHTNSINSLAFSPDNKHLASASSDRSVKLWNLTTRQEIATLTGHEAHLSSLAFSPDGKYLVTGSGDNTAKLWHLETRKEIYSLAGHDSDVLSVAFSPDGKLIATGSVDQTIKIWNALTGQPLRSLKSHSYHVKSVAFSPDGKWLASGSLDSFIKLWEVSTGRLIFSLSGHEAAVNSINFSPDGKRLASAGSDKTVILWDIITGQALISLKGHQDEVNAVAFSPDGKRLATGGEDKSVGLWNCAEEPDSTLLKWQVSFLNPPSAEPNAPPVGTALTHRANAVAFSPDGKILATGRANNKIHIFAAATGQELFSFMAHNASVSCLAFSANGKFLASGSGDKTAKIWQVGRWQEIGTFTEKERISSLAISPDSKYLATGNWDYTVGIWDINTGKKNHTLEGHTVQVSCVEFSPDGKWLASGSKDQTIKIWDARTGKEIFTLKGHQGGLHSLAFSPDGKLLASGSQDRTIKIWEVASGTELLSLKGHSQFVSSLVFLPGSQRKLLASGSEDHIIKIWDAESGQELLSLNRHTDAITATAFSLDGKSFASVSRDSSVKVWDVDYLLPFKRE